jgi:hypothetical protein
MIKSIFRILARILLILLVASAVVGLAYGASKMTGSAAPRFRPDDNPNFTQPGAPGGNNQAGQFARPPRGPGGDEGFRENGSITRGLFDVLKNILIIGVITWIGVIIFRHSKRRLPEPG